ncbi:hypothetical protein TNIN_373331 [Trichonephila inaurata madagascariensis]|uniref:Uncharacterized protein n=1 Tax=Trichonephila inaurata madagascariensis TaxID=2747483 RepID=A0A8X7C106_9ARAC|nr:hypothetical protein TNIN_373331 [Trichonephila inaurata madagascariensis]
MEECLILHIRKSSQKVWHYFQEDCSKQYPFICCVKDSVLPTTQTLNDNDVDNGINNQYNKDFYSVHDNSAKYHPIPNLSADPEKRSTVAGDRSGGDCSGALPREFHR